MVHGGGRLADADPRRVGASVTHPMGDVTGAYFGGLDLSTGSPAAW